MKALPHATARREIASLASALAEAPELSGALQTLSNISENLLGSYAALAARAERMDRELAERNEELARKVAELDSTRAHLEAVLQALPTGVVVRDGAGRVLRANAPARAILEANERDPGLSRGAGRVIERRCSEITSPDGSAQGSVEILDDRTELARLEQRLHSHDKLAALGTMAAGIAHEIRNPLNAVRGFAELLRREISTDSKHSRWATRICDGVDEADAIISNMLSFGAPEKLQKERVEAAELVESAIALARRSLPPESAPATWAITSAARCPAFEADRIKLRQALRNLVANALEAQPEGGSVHVACALRGDAVEFDVYDAGPGIAPELCRRVVDPFFTTRAEGTGLGLALVHTIAELHGGRFQVSAAPAPRQHGGGAHMNLSIPYHKAK